MAIMMISNFSKQRRQDSVIVTIGTLLMMMVMMMSTWRSNDVVMANGLIPESNQDFPMRLTSAPDVYMSKQRCGFYPATLSESLQECGVYIPNDIATQLAQRIQFAQRGVTMYETFQLTPEHGKTEAKLQTWTFAFTAPEDDYTSWDIVTRYYRGTVSFVTPTTPVHRERRKRCLRLIKCPRHRWIEHVPRGLYPDELHTVINTLCNAIRAHPDYPALALM